MDLFNSQQYNLPDTSRKFLMILFFSLSSLYQFHFPLPLVSMLFLFPTTVSYVFNRNIWCALAYKNYLSIYLFAEWLIP